MKVTTINNVSVGNSSHLSFLSFMVMYYNQWLPIDAVLYTQAHCSSQLQFMQILRKLKFNKNNKNKKKRNSQSNFIVTKTYSLLMFLFGKCCNYNKLILFDEM